MIEETLKRIEEKLDQLIANGGGHAAAVVEEVEDDLAGDDAPDEKSKTTLADVQDAVRSAIGRNKEKTKAALAKFPSKNDKKQKAQRATEINESDYDAAIAELNKVK